MEKTIKAIEVMKEKAVVAIRIIVEPLIWKHELKHKEKKQIEDAVAIENVKRIIPMSVMIIFISITNLILIKYVEVDELLKPLSMTGSIFMITAAIIVTAAATDVLTKEHHNKIRARAICVTYWISVVAGIMPFIYIDYIERGSLTNLVLYFVLCVMLPVVNLPEILVGVGAQLVLLTLITAMGGGKAYLLVQAMALSLLTVYVSQIAYCNYGRNIVKFKRLSEKHEPDGFNRYASESLNRHEDVGL